MKIRLESKTFRSKISRRIFTTFVLCALLPVSCLALFTYFQVTRNLKNQALELLRQTIKIQTKEAVDHLENVQNELEFVIASFSENYSTDPLKLNDKHHNRLLKYFNSISLFEYPLKLQPLFNSSTVTNLKFDSDQQEHLSKGLPLLLEIKNISQEFSLLMVLKVDSEPSTKIFLVGEINLHYLWSNLDNLPMDTGYFILDSTKSPFFSSSSNYEPFGEQFKNQNNRSTTGHYKFKVSNQEYIASFSEIFLRPKFHLQRWSFMLIKKEADILAPIARFKMYFIFFIVFTLLAVSWSSIRNIRKNLIPISALKRGVKKISEGDFSRKVNIDSNDEFQDLAIAFNNMSGTLNRHFKTLLTMTEIDRAVLSTLDHEEIIKESIASIRNLDFFDLCGISLRNRNSTSEGRSFFIAGMMNQDISVEEVRFEKTDCKIIETNPISFTITQNDTPPLFLPQKVFNKFQLMLVLPIFIKRELHAVLWIGRNQLNQFSNEDVSLSRQLADQLGVALSNSNLVDDLKEMSWSTLEALARTVDAKSPWTAGHSQRVSDLALKIGYELQLTSNSLDNLHRAGLLHDIGKVGISSAILDKPGKLTDEQYSLIKKHSALGAKILKPIKAYREIIPLVAQHHERYDGFGYPAGLSGENIELGARILAVADVYDALTSDRPYRNGMNHDKALAIMKEEAGKQFDPLIVDAMIAVTKPIKKYAA